MDSNDKKISRGRFFKKTDPILKHIKLTDFSLKEICSYPMTFADNSFASVFHKNLHDESELSKTIVNHSGLDKDLQNEESKRPIIKPLDFTDEWQKLKEKQGNRRYDGDEYDDEEFENSAFEEENVKKNSSHLEVEAIPNGKESSTKENIVIKKNSEKNSDDPIKKENLEAHNSNLDIQSDDLKSINESFSPLNIDEKMKDGKLVSEAHFVNDQLSDSLELPVDDSSKLKNIAGEKQLEEAFNEAKETGFNKGLEEGQKIAFEKYSGELQKLSNNLLDLLSNVAGLKKDILNSSTDNFSTVSKALIESLLEKEFAINPESLEKVIKRAISDSIKDDEFKVKINKKTYELISSNLQVLDKNKFEVDEDLPDFDFKIESNLTTIDGNIKNTISNLLDNADIDLFKNKVG